MSVDDIVDDLKGLFCQYLRVMVIDMWETVEVMSERDKCAS